MRRKSPSVPAATDAAASTAKATVIDAVRLLPDELRNNWWLNLGDGT